jgi:DNA-3-methyladenine glycosylase I
VSTKKRCVWSIGHPLNEAYHDEEWGVPVHDDRKLFEMMTLDLFQAGLSWLLMLKKREAFREAFEDFDPAVIRNFDEARVQELLRNKGIVRNAMKIRAVVRNADRFLETAREFGSFDSYIWKFTSHRTILHRYRTIRQIPTTTRESDAMSTDLRRRGFQFVGSTICYSFMQAVGMVNDHVVDCWRYPEIPRLATRASKTPS